ncbi:NAD(P)H-dependent FMN reductase [Streptosporangium album]|uniref:NAD(P)H-dependent FMN reductase n=1 Tax=Streptosporangium album TaxID=47479 RepID=A0A7W7S5D8_9ACTN|nr:NAD(P)H-dependent FMN reductase [Streptosporangium album]
MKNAIDFLHAEWNNKAAGLGRHRPMSEVAWRDVISSSSGLT